MTVARVDWKAPGPLPPCRSHRPEEDALSPRVLSSWLQVEGAAGYAGRRRDAIRAERDALFGPHGWVIAWRFRGEIVGRAGALELYEEAYRRHLEERRELLDWLCATGSEVYDNAPSNVESGFDYAIQETKATHLQDVAVRRAVFRLGRRFEGSELIEIRGRDSNGYALNPGLVPFHAPADVLPADPGGGRNWGWEPTSIEAFWQHNKLLLVDPAPLRGRPLVVGPEGLWAEVAPEAALLVPREGRTSRLDSPSAVRALWSVPRESRRHALVVEAPVVGFEELAAAAARSSAVTPGTDGRLVWGF